MVRRYWALTASTLILVAGCDAVVQGSGAPGAVSGATPESTARLTWVNPGGTTEWGVSLPIGSSSAAVFGVGEVCTEGSEAQIVAASIGGSDRVKARTRPTVRTDLFGANAGTLDTLGFAQLGTSVKTVCRVSEPTGDELLVEVSLPAGMDRSFATPLVFTYVDRNGRTGQFSVPVTIGMCRGTDRCTPPG